MTALKPYPEYKDSGVEWLRSTPSHWRVLPGKRCLSTSKEIVGGKHDEYERLSLTLRGVLPREKDSNEGLSPESFSTYQILRPGQLVFKMIDLENRKTSRVGLSFDLGLVSSAYIVASTGGSLNRLFAYFYYTALYNEGIYNHLGSGVRSTLNADDVRALPVPFPPLDEQRAIASFLDHETAEIDAFIADQQELIGLLNERRAATITQAVTKGLDPNAPMKDSGVEWLGDVPTHWSVTKLGRNYTVVLGKMLDAGKDPRAGAVPLPYIRAANIQDDGLDLAHVNSMHFSPAETANLSLLCGDLLVVEGGSIGTCYVLPEDMPGWSFQKTVNRVRARGQDSTAFLGYLIRTYRDGEVLDVICNRSTIAHLTAEKLHHLSVPRPPVAEQQEITHYLDRETAEIDAAIADAKEAIELSKERRAALISAAVTGKIDVRDHPAAKGAA